MFRYSLIFLIFFSLQVKAQTLPTNITISVPRGDDGGFVTMNLTKYSIRDTSHFKYYVDNQAYASNENAHPRSANVNNFDEETINDTDYPVRTYRGHIVEEPNSVVVAVIWPGNNKMSAFIQEGIRYLWDIKELPINLNLTTGNATINTTPTDAYSYAQINSKSSDWTPTFGNAPYPTPPANSGPVPNGNSPHGWQLIPQSGFKKMQIAYDVQPEWFNDLNTPTDQQVLAILEHATNLLDLQFARDLGIQYRMTGVVRRVDTDCYASASDTKTTWRTLGLGNNPGSSNVTANSIPFQHMSYTQKGEGVPVAFEGKQPLQGGNFTRVSVAKDDNGGLLHEISHTWGGSHFVYPRDIMSGGGSWFGPTTNQKHILNRSNTTIAGGLPIATNAEYGFNLHPYSTPDLVKTSENTSVTINVLQNDFDCNGDDIKIATFDATTPKNGTVTLDNGKLIYTPANGFIGRDQFNYVISDGALFNTTWVQVDVSNGGLEMRYDFETAGTTISDVSGANLNGTAVNFTATTGAGVDNSNGWVFPDLTGTSTDEDDTRAFISFGDVTDPFDKSHSVSIWFKVDSIVLAGNLNCYIVANSSSAKNKLIGGYNIYIDKDSKTLNFEVKEQLKPTSVDATGTLLSIIGDTVNANTWYHAVLVIDRDNQEVRGYMNGVKVGATQTLTPNGMIKGKPNGGRYTSGALGICTYKPKKYQAFIGVMDEFRVFGKGLSQDEINDLYTNPTENILSTTEIYNDNKNILLYPNPIGNDKNATIYFGNLEVSLLEIFNMEGKSIFKKEINSQQQFIELDFSSYNEGMYIIKLNSKNNVIIRKIIKN